MKIWTKLVIDFDGSVNDAESESMEYEGAIAE